jgi:Oxidoreductase family, NAD-binding Rossmann fold
MQLSSLRQTVGVNIRSNTAYNQLPCTGTHFSIAIYAIERGMHVLVTKPATQLLSHHNALIAAAKKYNVVCFVEHHKRQAFRFQ